MNKATIKTRLMEAEDFEAVVRIDEKVLNVSRQDYFAEKFELLFKSNEFLPTSFVALDESEAIVGFIIGVLYIGDFGISRGGATVDAVGVDPDYQRQGIGERLMEQFVFHLRQLDVKKVNTLVDKNDPRLMHYFEASQFSPSKTIVNLERSI